MVQFLSCLDGCLRENFIERWISVPKAGINLDREPRAGAGGFSSQAFSEFHERIRPGEQVDARIGQERLPVVKMKKNPEALDVLDKIIERRMMAGHRGRVAGKFIDSIP